MTGDSRVFQEALKRGSARGWRGEWELAVDEYRLAYQQFPEDASARTYLAMALFRSGRSGESLELYRELWRSQPANLTFLQRIAELEDGLGQVESAAASYHLLAELYGRRRASKEALRCWRRVVELQPNDLAGWDSLMDAASQSGAAFDPIPTCLDGARRLALDGNFEGALRIADRVRILDPSNPVAVPLINAIKRAFEFSSRTAAEGEQPAPEDIARLIPSLDVLATPPPVLELTSPEVLPKVEEPAESGEPEIAEAGPESPVGVEAADGAIPAEDEAPEEPALETPVEEIHEEAKPELPEAAAAPEMDPTTRFRDRWLRVLEDDFELVDDFEPGDGESISDEVEPDLLATVPVSEGEPDPAAVPQIEGELESAVALSAEDETLPSEAPVHTFEPEQSIAAEHEVGDGVAELPSGERFDALARLEADRALWERDPSDLSLLERVADQEEAVGELGLAAESYHILAQVFTKRAIYEDALRFWLKASQLQPGNRQFWASLLEVSAKADSVEEVLPLYLNSVRELALQARFQEAIEAADKAQSLDPDNRAILTLLLGIRRALERSWREAASGKDVSREELAELIPPVEPAPAARPASRAPQPVEEVDGNEPNAEVSATHVPVAETPSIEHLEVEEEKEEEVAGPSRGLLSRLDRWFSKGSRDSKKADASETTEATESQTLDAFLDAVQREPAAEAPGDGITSEDQPAIEESSVVEPFREEPLEELAVAPAGSIDESLLPMEGPRSDGVDLHAELEVPQGTVVESRSDEPAELEVPRSSVVEAPLDEPDRPAEDDAGASKTLREAEVLFRQSLAAGMAMAEQVVALGELEERRGNVDAALDAYARALGIAPDLPAALLGMARHRISSGDVELAEADLRRAIESDVQQRLRADASVVDLLLRLYRDKAIQGDPDAGASGLAWLLAAGVAHGFPPFLLDKLTPVAIELLGRCVGEHLAEIALLPPEAQQHVVMTLWRAEEQLSLGCPRSAADEAYQMLAAHPTFLPAQSMLARVCAVRGRQADAHDRWSRLIPLYELRGTPGQTLEILWWMVAYGVADDTARGRLLTLLRSRDRLDEAALVESDDRQEMLSRWGLALIPRRVKPDLGLEETEAAIGAARVAEPPADEWDDVEPALLGEQPKVGESVAAAVPQERAGKIPVAWESMLASAESRFRSGDRQGASELIEAALRIGEGLDDMARAALLRVMQMIDPTRGRRAELVEILGRLGLSEEFAE